MENTSSYARRLNVNLNDLPPINNPRIGNENHSSIPAKFEKSVYIRRVPQFLPPNYRPEMEPNDYNGLPTKPVPSSSVDEKKEKIREIAQSRCSSCGHCSTKKGNSEKRVAKSLLFEICTANHWQPPLFECCEEEGPSHAKKYRFKVVVEMKGAFSAVLECYGNPQRRKKVAAEHAAEGALWYLKHLGYRSKR